MFNGIKTSEKGKDALKWEGRDLEFPGLWEKGVRNKGGKSEKQTRPPRPSPQLSRHGVS